MLQKQKTNPPEDDKKPKKPGEPTGDQKLKDAAKEGKDLLSRMDQATKKKSGHWENCCGVKVWVED